MVTVTIKREGATEHYVRVTAESIERAVELCPGEVQFPLDREDFFGGQGPSEVTKIEVE